MINELAGLWCLMKTEIFLAAATLALVVASAALGKQRCEKIRWIDLTLGALILALGLHLSGWGFYTLGFMRSYAGDSLSFGFKTLLILCAIGSLWLARKAPREFLRVSNG